MGRKITRIHVKCTLCNKLFNAHLCDLKLYNHHFCSQDCFKKWKKSNNRLVKFLTKSYLFYQYWNLQKTCNQIAKIIKCSYQTINDYMKKLNIPLRTRSESKIGKFNGMFGKLGLLHPNYIPNISRIYPIAFNLHLKEEIRHRDNYECRLCHLKEKEHIKKYKQLLNIHHIDYDKTNYQKENLVTLCRKCHNITTNTNRNYWYAYFSYIMEKK